MLFLQLAHLALALLQSGFEGQSLDQHGLAGLQGDDGMGDAFAAREEKAGPLLGVVLAHPSLQIDVANRQIKGLDQCGIACCDAVLPEGQFPIEDAVVDSVGV